jgi:hypothetical protein
MNFINSIKGRTPYASALLNNTMDGINVSGAYGANWTVISEPTPIADGANGSTVMWYYVPMAYSDGDYRGAIFAQVTNSTMQLQLTINPASVVNSTTTDTTNAVYSAAGGAGSNTSTTITVFQDYLDQLPVGPNGGSYVLPIIDLSTIYELKNTLFTAITANNDYPIPYPNFREFYSTIAIYNNDGKTRTAGTDINYWALQASNLTNIFKISPQLSALRTRALLHTDLPLGVYYFGSRVKPLNTQQYGNLELVINASTAGAAAYVAIGWEDMGMQNVLKGAGSLPAGG